MTDKYAALEAAKLVGNHPQPSQRLHMTMLHIRKPCKLSAAFATRRAWRGSGVVLNTAHVFVLVAAQGSFQSFCAACASFLHLHMSWWSLPLSW
jgi:hypothetical protein